MPSSSSQSLTYKSTVSVQQQLLHSTNKKSKNNTNNSNNTTTLKFDDGAIQFRQRICVSILTHRRLLIRNIRNGSNNNNSNNSSIIGLQQHEASFLKLIDSITNGSTIEINTTGTQMYFQPGILLGGTIVHDCPIGTITTANTTGTAVSQDDIEIQQLTARNIGWYIEGILPLAPFGKEPLRVTFTGITENSSDNCSTCYDLSCDYLRTTVLPLLPHFGIGGPTATSSKLQPNSNDMLDDDNNNRSTIKIIRRGGYPLGGGCVEYYCPMIRTTLLPSTVLQDYTDMGKIKRIRGTVITTQLISSSVAARIAYSAKGICHKLLPDVWIHTDIHTNKNQHCGPSPSVNLLLHAESTNGVIYTSEVSLRTTTSTSTANNNSTNNTKELPEELGVRGAVLLLQEIYKNGGSCIDTPIQSLVLLLMCLCPEHEVLRIRCGPITSNTIVSLRLFQYAFGVTFKIQPSISTTTDSGNSNNNNKTILISGIGIGYKNMARAST